MNITARIKKLEARTEAHVDPNETVILVVHGDAGPVRQTIRLGDRPGVGLDTIRIEVQL